MRVCLVLFWSACAVPVCPVLVLVVLVVLVLVWAGCCPWLGGVGAPAGCERVSSAAADGGADLWWRPCCGAACLSLLCLAWLGLVWSGLCRRLCGGLVTGVCGSAGRAGAGCLRWGPRWWGLVVCPGSGGSGGGARYRGVGVGAAGSPVCFCAGAGVWPGVWSGGDWAAVSGWVGLGWGADR